MWVVCSTSDPQRVTPTQPMNKQILNETLRLRLPDGWKKRASRVAKKRGCDMSDVAREGMLVFLDSEEKRLAINNGKTK